MNNLNLHLDDSLLLSYLDAGFALVPIPSGSKGPSSPGWNRKENAICSPVGLSLITGNVGIAHAHSYPLTCAVDVDNRELASVWLTERGVDLSALLDAGDAVQIVSGREGRAKLLYRLPLNASPLETKQIKEGDQMILELRCSAKNGTTVQDVLPPSIHPDTGKPYSWGGNGHFSKLPDLPSSLLAIWEEMNEPRRPEISFFDVPQSTGHIGTDAMTLSLIGMPETAENIQKVLDALSRVSADCSYPQWRDILFALKSTGWDAARRIAKQWSMSAPHRWNAEAFDSLWNKASRFGGITIGTLFHMAKSNQPMVDMANWEPEAREPLVAHKPYLIVENGRLSIPIEAPPQRSYLFGESVMPGTPCILAGLGGTAKTTFIMQLAIHGALGKNIGPITVSDFSSILLLGEENQEERDRRMGGLCAQLSDQDRMTVERRVLCFPAAGKDLRLNAFEGQNLRETTTVNDIVVLSEAHAQASGSNVGLIVLDHARLVMSGDPNAANDVTQLTRIMNHIAMKTGAAVMLLAHSPKSSHAREEGTDASEIFGSSAFVDNVRTAFVLHTMRPKEAKEYGIDDAERNKYVCLETVKSNYGPQGTQCWFRKMYLADWQVVWLQPELLYSQKLFQNHSALSQRLIDLIKQNPGQLTERKIRDRAGKNGSLKASEAEVMNSLNRLVEGGELVEREPSDLERKKYKLSANIKLIFALPIPE